MKVPYLNKRIEKEFERFLEELEMGVSLSVKDSLARKDKELYSDFYPLFAMIRTLSDSEHTPNPARDVILSEISLTGDKKDFLSAIAFFNKPHAYQDQLSTGMQKRVFTGFFHELFSDCLLLLNSFYSNNYRGAQIALRCMLEDLYRHLYYRDHPQEFWAVTTANHSEHEIGIRPQTLRDYLKRTNYLEIFKELNQDFEAKKEKDKTLFDINDELYARSSAAVHGSASTSLNKFQSNLDLKYLRVRAAATISDVKLFVSMAVAFLAVAHIDQFLAFNDYERSLIFAKYSGAERAALRRALNV